MLFLPYKKKHINILPGLRFGCQTGVRMWFLLGTSYESCVSPSRCITRAPARHCYTLHLMLGETFAKKNKTQKIWSQQTHTSHKALRNPPGFNYNQYTKIMWQDKTGTWNVHGFVSAPNKHTAQVKVFLLVLISGTSLWCQSTLSPKRD